MPPSQWDWSIERCDYMVPWTSFPGSYTHAESENISGNYMPGMIYCYGKQCQKINHFLSSHHYCHWWRRYPNRQYHRQYPIHLHCAQQKLSKCKRKGWNFRFLMKEATFVYLVDILWGNYKLRLKFTLQFWLQMRLLCCGGTVKEELSMQWSFPILPAIFIPPNDILIHTLNCCFTVYTRALWSNYAWERMGAIGIMFFVYCPV